MGDVLGGEGGRGFVDGRVPFSVVYATAILRPPLGGADSSGGGGGVLSSKRCCCPERFRQPLARRGPKSIRCSTRCSSLEARVGIAAFPR